MAGIDNLKNRLLEDDKKRAAEIENEAKVKADEIINGAKLKASDILEDIKQRAEKDGKERKERLIARAQLDARNSILKAKQQAIDKVFSLVIERVSSMNKTEYEDFIKKLLINNVETGEEEVIFSNNDKERINSNVIDEVNNELKRQGKNGNLKLSSDTRNILSGFILKRGGLEINCSIDSQIRAFRENLEGEIATLLFSK
ncbi:V/A-type H+-transporting ATPase subunit E [Caloramator quimbayensis]|uniref:V-type proton ATPase subunit E n=1 Tax=Caloramator quimbayensis TaxID=1147123 RepID=A0A1T4XP01_9CLOT|nr:V-type ATP synthase subunit E [Caloramator quimbayensis]SKA90785.1 V/A-type H+-transporting ATPase subunit E [Caloramator quimbayensis]